MILKKIYYRTLPLIECLQRKTRLKSPPGVFQVELTNACQMRCIMCVRRYMKRPIGFMDFAIYRRIVDEVKDITRRTGVVHPFRLHHFGESLLHQDLYNFLAYARIANLPTMISANPTALTEKAIEAVCRGGLKRLMLSIDGTTDADYKRIRGNAADLTQAIHNINALIEYKRAHGYTLPEITVSMIVMRETENQIKDFKRQWKIPGIKAVRIKSFMSWAGENKDVKDHAPQQQKHTSGQLHYHPIFKLPFIKTLMPHQCLWPWHRMSILWDGRVVPCCRDYDGLYVLGNLNQQTLAEIWNGKPMQALRERALSPRLSDNELCRQCELY